MSTRVAKKQLSAEELRLKDEQKRLKRNENTRRYRAKKRAAAKGKKTSTPKKAPICESFPPEHMKAYNYVKVLRRNGRSAEITPELLTSVSIINNLYKENRIARLSKNNGGAVKRIREAVGNLFWPKPAPQKKEVSKKAPKKYENKTPNTTDEEYECWREYNKKGSSSQEPSRKEKALRYISIKSRFEREQKNPNIKKKRSKYDNDIKLEEPILPALVVVEPLVVTPVPKRVNALDDLAAQYASDDEDAEEHFYANWRPTPAPRPFNSSWRPTPAPREIKPKRYHEGIDALKWREADQDSKTHTEEKRKSMQLAAKSMTVNEALAYAKKEGYKVITQKSAGRRFYFKGGNKSKDTKFNYTAQRIDADINRQLEKKNKNEAYRKKFRNARVWVLE